MPAPNADPPAPASSPAGRLGGRDWVALAALVLIPVAFYVPFSASGNPLVPQDDLVQNFPLRVLVGDLLRQGHLPLWDPQLWSGTPLLAGWNAGAAFPLTWLFAALSPVAAWTVNLVFVPAAASSGLYVLLRRLTCRPAAALLAALVFADTGFLSGQIVHLGLAEGTAITPWMLVGVDALARAPWRRIGGPVALIGVSFGLVVLAGDPRAGTSAAILAGCSVLGWVWRAPRGAFRLLVGTAAGGLLGLGLSAVQWLPGLRFIDVSQRGMASFSFYASGAVRLTHLLSLVLVPFFLGGNGNFGLPSYFGGYNLAELTIGVGFVALAGALALLPEVAAAGVAFARRHRRRARPLGVWYATALLGALLTIGPHSPAGRLFAKVPFFGSERLQSRNAVIFDFAFCVLLAYFLDDVFGAGVRATLGDWRRRLLATLPSLGAVVLIAVVLADPSGAARFFDASPGGIERLRSLAPYDAATVVLAAAVAGFVILGHRLKAPARRVGVVVLVLCDIAVYVSFADYETHPSHLLAPSSTSRAISRLANGGRVAVYDPLRLTPANRPRALGEVGASDLNLLDEIPSVNGYGSLVGAAYAADTGTHDYADLDTTALERGAFAPLDLKVLLTLPAYLAQPIGAATTLAEVRTDEPAPAARPWLRSGPWVIPAGSQLTWRLPGRVQVASLTVLFSSPPPPSILLSLSSPATSRRLTAAVSEKSARADLARPVGAEFVALDDPAAFAVVVEAVVVTTASGERIVLDGVLQGALDRQHWSERATIDGFLVFVNRHPARSAWLEAKASRTATPGARARGSIRAGARDALSPTMLVAVPKAALLVRSVAFAPGWQATLVGAGGRRLVEAAHPLGLVQAVPVPAGRWRVTWSYVAPGFALGSALSLAALGVLVACGLLGAVVVELARRRRRDRAKLARQLP